MILLYFQLIYIRSKDTSPLRILSLTSCSQRFTSNASYTCVARYRRPSRKYGRFWSDFLGREKKEIWPTEPDVAEVMDFNALQITSVYCTVQDNIPFQINVWRSPPFDDSGVD